MDGTFVDSSIRRGKAFEFELGTYKVIEAWEWAVP